MASLAEAKSLARAGRDREAVEMIRGVAAAGDPEGLFLLGEMQWRGGLVEQDSAAARRSYEEAAQRGHPRAGIYATNLLASGIAGPRDWPEAVRRLKREAAGDPTRRAAFDLIRSMALESDGSPSALPPPTQLSTAPRVQLFAGLATPAECRYLIAIAQPGYQPSMVYDASAGLVRDTIRTSDGSTIHWLIEDPVVHAINRRIAAATATPYENGETLQSLRYSPGQEYRPHFDFVPGDNRRIWTALLYLNDDYEGGETAFVQTGLKVRGGMGDLLIFANAADDGQADPLAEHAGLPVSRGVKFLATRWIREKRWVP